MTTTHTYAILEIDALAYRHIRSRLEDSAHGDPAVLEQIHRDYLGRDDDDGELLVFGTVAFKSMPIPRSGEMFIPSTWELLDERTQQLDDLSRDVRELVDELKGPQLPAMILECDNVGARGVGTKCLKCGHVFELGDRLFEGDRCADCAKIELTVRFELHHKRALNLAELEGGVRGFPFGRR